MISPRFIAAFAVFLLSLVATSRASAQTLTVESERSLPRLDATGQQIPKRVLTLSPEAINARDCRDDQRIRFPLRMSGFTPQAVVQIWASAGADCKLQANRTGEFPPCWQLESGVPLQAAIDVDVPVRKILSDMASAEICGAIDLTSIDVQIMMFEHATAADPLVSKTVIITADTIGPEPPRAAVAAGNGRARVEIHPSGKVSSLVAVNAYCEKSTSTDACTGTALMPGFEPDPARECGSIVGNGGTVLFAGPLENGESHRIAIAAVDAFGNLGELSSVTCTTPSPDAETKVGSVDEPTGCAMSTRPNGANAGVVVVMAIGLLVRRRRRKGQRDGEIVAGS